MDLLTAYLVGAHPTGMAGRWPVCVDRLSIFFNNFKTQLFY